MTKPWKVADSSVLLDDEWLRVRSDRCITGTGKRVEPFYVLEYVDWINVVALTADGRLVLVRQYRHAAGTILTGLVAGRVEPGEPPAQAAERELREETGYTGKLTLLGSYWANPATQSNRVWSYLATDIKELPAELADPIEEIEVVRRPLIEVLRECWTGRSELQGLHLAALYLALPHFLRKGLIQCSDLPGAQP